jgi:hypothetical protein
MKGIEAKEGNGEPDGPITSLWSVPPRRHFSVIRLKEHLMERLRIRICVSVGISEEQVCVLSSPGTCLAFF